MNELKKQIRKYLIYYKLHIKIPKLSYNQRFKNTEELSKHFKQNYYKKQIDKYEFNYISILEISPQTSIKMQLNYIIGRYSHKDETILVNASIKFVPYTKYNDAIIENLFVQSTLHL